MQIPNPKPNPPARSDKPLGRKTQGEGHAPVPILFMSAEGMCVTMKQRTYDMSAHAKLRSVSVKDMLQVCKRRAEGKSLLRTGCQTNRCQCHGRLGAPPMPT